jgi:hypothetical protein
MSPKFLDSRATSPPRATDKSLAMRRAIPTPTLPFSRGGSERRLNSRFRQLGRRSAEADRPAGEPNGDRIAADEIG